MPDCYQRSEVRGVKSLPLIPSYSSVYILFIWGHVFLGQFLVCVLNCGLMFVKIPKVRIVGSLFSKRFNGKEKNIRVSVFHLEEKGQVLGFGGSCFPSRMQTLVRRMTYDFEYVANKLPGNRMTFILCEAMSI